MLELSLSTVLVGLFVPLVAGIYGRRRSERAALIAMLAAYAESLRSTADARLGAVGEHLLHKFPLFPSAVGGTMASLVGYVLGHWSVSDGRRG